MNNQPEFIQTENCAVPAPEMTASEMNDRREALKKLGKFSAYVAPFTVLALANKAQAGSGHGPAPTPQSRSAAGR